MISSGLIDGLIDIVKAVLPERKSIDKVTAIHAADIDAKETLLRIHSAFESDTELVAKVRDMAQYPAGEKVAVGDSVTDINIINIALAVDLVFARDCALKESAMSVLKNTATYKVAADSSAVSDTAPHKASRSTRKRCGGHMRASPLFH